ncbi:MAG: hypothetical protein CME15_06695, partial [Gemmatimonadetes bacterium]|nr:hypothetical protein [Gemmatimonadota bacterium]
MAEVMTGYLRQIIMDQFDAACHVWGVLTRSNMAMDHGEIRTVVCPASFETPRKRSFFPWLMVACISSTRLVSVRSWARAGALLALIDS